MSLLGASKWSSIQSAAMSTPTLTESRSTSKVTNTKKCVSNLSQILLIVNFNHPFYSNIPLLSKFYKDIFYDVVFCGPKESKTFKVIHIQNSKRGTGYYGYHCAKQAMEQYPNAAGYLFSNDDMVVNWWNYISLDPRRIWIGNKVALLPNAEIKGFESNGGIWWIHEEDLKKCGHTLHQVNNLIKTEAELDWKPSECKNTFFRNTGGKNQLFCLRSWSDFFYIPKRLRIPYIRLSEMFHTNDVFLEIAANVILMMLDDDKNKINVNGVYLPEKYLGTMDFANGTVFWKTYTTKLSFIHPLKLGVTEMNRAMFNVLIDHADLRRKLCKIRRQTYVS